MNFLEESLLLDGTDFSSKGIWDLELLHRLLVIEVSDISCLGEFFWEIDLVKAVAVFVCTHSSSNVTLVWTFKCLHIWRWNRALVLVVV